MHSSPDGASSFSHVQSMSRSESPKRSRQAIEDAERENRPVGRMKGSTARSSTPPSPPKSGKTPSVRRMFPGPRSGGSPRDKRGAPNADEKLEAKLREIESGGNKLKMSM